MVNVLQQSYRNLWICPVQLKTERASVVDQVEPWVWPLSDAL